MTINKEQIPSYLKDYVKEIKQNGVLVDMTICSSKGNELLDVWYYGELFEVTGENQPYIGNTENTPEKIVVKDTTSGEEILIFDGAKHGYDNLFCEEYDLESIKNRPLKKYNIPTSKLILRLAYNINYEDEKEEYEIDDNNNVTLIDGSTLSWDDVKRNGFDYIALYFVDQNGKKVQFFDRELA